MPTNRIRKTRGRVVGAELSEMEMEDLTTGYCFFDEPFRTNVERRECWKKHRAEIMRLQGKPIPGKDVLYFNLFERPDAWWRYDAPALKLYVKCNNSFCPYFSRCPVVRGIGTERPLCVIREWLFKTECVTYHFQIFLPIQESEREFLGRHDLLTEEEKKLIENNHRLDIPPLAGCRK